MKVFTVLLMSLCFLGCPQIDLSEIDFDGFIKGEFTKLNAPQNIHVDENRVKWNSVVGATGYLISIYDGAGVNIGESVLGPVTEYVLQDIALGRVKTIKIKSLGDGDKILDSVYSFSLSFDSTIPFDREEVAYDDSPLPLLPVPTPAQLSWQKLEQYAFIHYGPNTYQNREWGEGKPGEAAAFQPTGSSAEYTKQWIDEMKALGMNGLIFTAKHHDGFCLFQTKTTLFSLRNPIYSGGGNDDIVRDLAKNCYENDMRLGLYLSPSDRNSWGYIEDEYKYIFKEQVKELIEIAKSQQGADPFGLFEIWFDGANQDTGWFGGGLFSTHQDAPPLPVDENGDWVGGANFDYYPHTRNPSQMSGRGSVANNSPYINEMINFAKDYIMANNENVVIFGSTIRWIGNEQGWAGRTNWCMGYGANPMQGVEDDPTWLPGEVDVKTEWGWFHNTSQLTPRTYREMIEFWYRSVGRNANLLLNFSPTRSGLIQEATLVEARKYWATIQKHFETNLVADPTLLDRVEASNIRGNSEKYSANNLIDEDFDTYWATDNDIIENASIVLSFKQDITFNRVMIQEYIPLGQRVKAFKVEYSQTEDGDDWQIVTYPNMPTSIHGDSNNPDVTTSIGYKRILRANDTVARRVKVTFIENRFINVAEQIRAEVPFVISKIGLYNAVDPVF